MTSTATTGDPETFRVPREPRLGLRLLNPVGSRRPLPVPVPGRATFHLFWARSGIYHGLGALGLKPGDAVLVPAFHCASLVEPILHYGASVRFFRVDERCAPDLADIRSKIDGKTRAILVVHYFGFPQGIEAVRALCDEHGLALIEDCAHVLTGTIGQRPLGSFGDISIFSWRKFLPVYDGGVLVIDKADRGSGLRLQDPAGLLTLRIWKNVLDRAVADSTVPGTRALARLLRYVSAAGRRVAARNGQPAASLAVNNYSLDFDPESLALLMSSPSQRILRQVDFAAVTEARRRNYRTLAGRLAGVSEVATLFPALPDGVCPWVLPLVACRRSGFHRALRARGIPAATWGDVIHRDLRLDDFPEARFLYDRLMFLPVHQSLTERDLDACAQAVREVAAESA